jgi:hypothetical protein
MMQDHGLTLPERDRPQRRGQVECVRGEFGDAGWGPRRPNATVRRRARLAALTATFMATRRTHASGLS